MTDRANIEGQKPRILGRPGKALSDTWDANIDSAEVSVADIAASGIFDLEWYKGRVGRNFSQREAIIHYLDVGHLKGNDPNRHFDGRWYLQTYKDVAAAGLNPLLHYVRSGEAEGRCPNAFFDPKWYLSKYPDIADVGISPLFHFIRDGEKEGRLPSPHRMIEESGLFDYDFYCDQMHPFDNLAAAIKHYIHHGAASNLDPNPYFDTAWYREIYVDVGAAGINPLVHYIENGEAEGRSPSARFDTRWYLRRYSDVQAKPLAHFLKHGMHEDRHPNALAEDAYKRERMLAIDGLMLPSDQPTTVRLQLTLGSLTDRAARLNWQTFPSRWPSAASSRSAPSIGFPPPPSIVHAARVGVLGGSRHLMSADGELLDDELNHFVDPGVAIKRREMRRKDANIEIAVTRRYGTRLERGVHLMHEYDTNYFHFIAEVLPRAIVVAECGDIPHGVPYFVSQNLHRNFVELLKGVIGDLRPVVELERDTLYFADEVFYCTDVSVVQDVYERPRLPGETEIHAPLIRLARDRFVERTLVAPVAGRSRRVYIKRGARMRGVSNEREVCEALVSLGFEILTLDDLSVATQVRLFAEADLIVGATGAGITNLIWCKPGTPVLVLASNHPAMPSEVWTQLGEVSGCHVRVTSERRTYAKDGLYGMHDDFEVDVKGLVSLVMEMA